MAEFSLFSDNHMCLHIRCFTIGAWSVNSNKWKHFSRCRSLKPLTDSSFRLLYSRIKTCFRVKLSSSRSGIEAACKGWFLFADYFVDTASKMLLHVQLTNTTLRSPRSLTSNHAKTYESRHYSLFWQDCWKRSSTVQENFLLEVRKSSKHQCLFLVTDVSAQLQSKPISTLTVNEQ